MSYYSDPSQQQQQPFQNEAPLPHGWIKEFDQTSQNWYFVDTQSPNPTPVWNDPRSSTFPINSNPSSSYSSQPQPSTYGGGGGGGGEAASFYGSAPPPSNPSPYDSASPYPGQPGGPQEGQEEFFTDETRSATSTQDRGFGKVVLGVGAAGMAMWLAKKYFADKKQSSHQQSYGPPPGQNGGYVQNPWGGGPPPPGSQQHQGGQQQWGGGGGGGESFSFLVSRFVSLLGYCRG
ncbi:hypothetical protein BDY24DRAFT_164722 [Mrakia frigida]|uniref:uncharacterized protein n=1 Tax=Mrakia frigida TaxID=29902 RepID=UPI003FCC1BA1